MVNLYSVIPLDLNNFFLRVCLVGMKIGRMKNRDRKIEWKMIWKQVFSLSLSLSPPFKIQSLQIGEKIGVKSGKNIWTKLPPPLFSPPPPLNQTMENVIFHPIFLFLFFILPIFIPTKHTLKALNSLLLFHDFTVPLSLSLSLNDHCFALDFFFFFFWVIFDAMG